MTSKSECNQPISTAMPSAVELRNNKELEAYLTRNCNIFETDEGQFKRSGVIDKINQILQAWAIEVGTSKNIAAERLINGGGIHLRIFGSTRLNVHNGDSDIDTLCLAPSYITKGDFFSTFVEKLQSRHDVETLTAIGEAYTPVIKFTIDNQSVDMVFASIAAKDVDGNLQNISPSFDILDLKCLKGLDDASVRSINGARVAEKICNLVPNMDNYCSTLRIIKYWARQRGLYSNVLGFLGGVNYAILVAFICQLYSNACTYTLVNKFFNVLTMWRWPAPILICAFEDVKLTDSSGRYLPVWNPKVNYKDALHLMPIITPAYPAMNSAYNVASPQFRCIQEEILRGNLLFQNHSTTNGAVFNWNRFFEPCTKEFFSKYPRYIQVDISATSVADHRSWFGWVESRFRTLIISLEQPPVIFSHPMANCFHRHPGNTGGNSSVTTSSISNIADFPAIGETVAATAENNSNCGNSGVGVGSGELSVLHPNNIDNISSPLMSRQNSSESDIDLFKTMQLHSGTKPAVPMSYKSILAGNSPKSAKTVPSPSAAAPATSGVYHYTMTTPERGGGGNSGHSSNQTDGVAGNVNGAAEGDETGLYISSFFVGLSFQQGVNFADVTPAIADFTSRVNNWMLKKPNMECNISSFNYENVPSFVFETTAEPSSVKSCTPKVNRTRPPAVPANGYVGANGKGNDDGEEDYLHSRLIRSSVVETGVKKSQTPKNSIINVSNSSNSNNNNNSSGNNNTNKSQNKVESLQNTVTFQNDTQAQQNTNNKNTNNNNSNSMSRKMSIDDVTTVTTTGTAGNTGGNVNFGQGRKMSVEDVYGDDYSSSNSGNYSNIPPMVPLSQAQLVHHNQQQQQQLLANSRSRGNSTLSNNADNHHPNNSNHPNHAVKVLFANDDSPVRQMTPSAQQQHGMYQHPHMVPQQVTQHQYFLHQQQLLQQQQQLQQQMGGQHHPQQPPAGYALSGPAPDNTAHGGNSPPIISKSPSAQQQKQYQQNQFQNHQNHQQLYPMAPHLMTSFPPQLISVNGGGSTSNTTSVNSSTATSPHGNQHGHTQPPQQQPQQHQHGHGNASLPTPPGLLFPSPLMPPAMYAAHYGSGHLGTNMSNMPNIPLQNMQFVPSGGSGGSVGSGAGNVSINNAMNNGNNFNSSAFPYPLPPHLIAPGMPNLQGGMAPQMLHNNVFVNNGAAGATGAGVTGAGGENLSPGGQNRQGGPGANPMVGQQLPPNQMLSFNQFVQHQMMLQQAQLQAQQLQSQQLQAQQAPNAPPGLSPGDRPDRSEFAETSGPPGQLPIHFGSFPNPANTPATQQSQQAQQSQPPQQQFPHTAQYFQQHMKQAHPQQSQQQPPASSDASGNAASTASGEQHAAPEMQQPHAHIFNSPPKRIKKETLDNHTTASNQSGSGNSSGGNSNARQNQQQHTSANANNKTNNNSSNNSNKSNQRARGETR